MTVDQTIPEEDSIEISPDHDITLKDEEECDDGDNYSMHNEHMEPGENYLFSSILIQTTCY